MPKLIRSRRSVMTLIPTMLLSSFALAAPATATTRCGRR